MNSVLQSTLRELQIVVGIGRLWLVFSAVVFLFVVTGPFGTLQFLDLPTRLGYWLIVHGVAWCLALTLVILFDVALERWITQSLTRMMIGAAFAALPIGILLTIINHAFLDTPLSMAKTFENMATALPISLALCLLTWLSLGSPAAASGRDRKADEEPDLLSPQRPAVPADAEEPAQRPALLDRLPAEKRAPVVRLEAQDHYVQIVTRRGAEMVLMRLSDAINEMPDAAGMAVHRSHWIAFEAMEGLEREPGKNGRSFIVATDGARLPVSRSALPELRRRFDA